MAAGFFATRLNGAVAIDRLFWIDMALVGTLINIAAALVAVLALGFKVPDWLAIALYLAPMPYNLFLVVTVSRSARDLQAKPANAYRFGALLWLAASAVI